MNYLYSLPEKPIYTQPVKKFHTFMEPDVHRYGHRIKPLGPVMSQLNAVCIITP